MTTVYIDGQAYEVQNGRDLLSTCLSLGFDLPYFCWHPALGSVGACRQCAVKQFKDEHDTQGRIVMACMTPAAEGTRIAIQDPEAREFRASVIEWLMVNHPHDCPVCDEGGECHLQDMTVMTGHAYRETRFPKRTYRNQYLGPFINHEMNRCIQCYRCVRFYRDYAGGRDLDVFGAHDHVYFGRHEDGVLESEFSGNLVEVCPTGVFTDKTLKQHYTRKWDLQTAPSICAQCGLGCNTIAGERYGGLRRISNRYHHQVNGYFICDRGRFGYEYVNSERRIRQPLFKRPGSNALTPLPSSPGKGAGGEGVDHPTVLSALGPLLENRERVVGIGSPRASVESNFALRSLVGPERFFQGISPAEHRLIMTALRLLREGPARSPSLQDVRECDAVFVLGEDLTNSAPVLALALRQSVRRQPMHIAEKLGIPAWNDAAVREALQDETGPLYIAVPWATKLDDVASRCYRAAPDDLARLGFAVAHKLDENNVVRSLRERNSNSRSELPTLTTNAPPVPDLSDELRTLAAEIAEALRNAERPLVISGTSTGSEAVLQAAAQVAWALCRQGRPAQLSLTVPEGNSLGLALMGGDPLEQAIEFLKQGRADTVVILENDLHRRAAPETVNELFEAAQHSIVLDSLPTRTTDRAEVVLPAATVFEGDGTLVNNEGRAQRFYQVFVPEGDVQESWRWIHEMATAAGREQDAPWHNLDEVLAALVEALPVFAPVPEIAPPAGFRVDGARIPRESHRYSGRTAMTADNSVHEPKPPDDPDSPLAFSMEGYPGEPPAPLLPRYWAPGWNSVQALNKFQQEVGGPMHGGDPGRRLIEPAPLTPRPSPSGGGAGGEGTPSYFENIPSAFQQREGEWYVVGVPHIFGSEEFSVLTPAVAERAPQPYVALRPDDADALKTQEGDVVYVHVCGGVYRLPVRFLDGLPRGLAGLPLGLPNVQTRNLPAWGTIRHGGTP